MKNTRQNNCDDVVDLLVKKYWSESKSELDQKIAQIAQDFISRKLFNSTVRISKQLHTEYEFVQKLIEQIIESLKQDFSHIPLATCKDKLLSIVEIEYKKLIPKTTARLVEGNLAQKGMLENYGKGILAEMEKAKGKVKIQCTILEKQKVFPKSNTEKWYQNRTIQAALIGGFFVLLAAIITNPLWVPFIYETRHSTDVVKPIKKATATVEVTIKSDDDFDGLVANVRAYLAFMKGQESLLKTSSIGYKVRQRGNGQVVYQGNLTMDAGDSAIGHPVSFLKDTDYILVMFGSMPSNSLVLGGRAICTINNVNLEFSIPQQKVKDRDIIIRDIAEPLKVLNERGNEEK